MDYKMIKWEYAVESEYLDVNPTDLLEGLNRMGKAGWELVTCMRYSIDTYQYDRLVFKRLLVEEVLKQEAWTDKGLT